MQFVVDANILFAALIKDSVTIEILVEEFVDYYTPEWILEEFYKNKDEILAKSDRTLDEFEKIFEYLKQRITIVPKDDYQEFLDFAEKIAPHEKDAPYLALALKLKIPVWSNDRNLKEKQNQVKVYNTREILEGGLL